jgi:hypothetical protein
MMINDDDDDDNNDKWQLMVLFWLFPQDNELVFGGIFDCVSSSSYAMYWTQVLEGKQ